MIDDIKNLKHDGQVDYLEEAFVNIKYGNYITFQLIKMSEEPERWVCRVFIKDSLIGTSKPAATNAESLYDGKDILGEFITKLKKEIS